METVDSVVAAMAESDFQCARIIIFNGEPGTEHREEVAAALSRHADLAGVGALTVQHRADAVESGESGGEAEWKRRQVQHCAALMDACREGGDYYLHLEDDVIAAPGYLHKIELRVREHQKTQRRWAILSFYNSFPITDGVYFSEYHLTRRYFGLIGQLFRTRDLASLTEYLREHQTDGPVDTLVGRWALATGGTVIGHSPSLFQHVGVLSSYCNEIQIWDTPQFVELPGERKQRLRTAIADINTYHPGCASGFLRYRARLRATRKA